MQYKVLRQDDNGNTFIVEVGLTKDKATSMVAKHESRSHKQTYWLEVDDDELGQLDRDLQPMIE